MGQTFWTSWRVAPYRRADAMKCANCKAVLSGEPTCPTCGTLYTVSRSGASIPSIVQDLEARLAAALEGRYEMRGLLGHGGMGAVFLAAETSLDRLVAIKVLPPSLSMDEELLTREHAFAVVVDQK